MSVTLVAFFTTDSGGNGLRRRAADLGSINGQPIPQAEYFDAWKEIRIASYLHTGKWPSKDESSNQRMESEVLSRVFILQKAREMDIKASDRAVGLLQQEQLHDYSYATFEKEHLLPNGVTAADYERYTRNEAAIRQLIAAASATARLVTAAEAEGEWKKANQETLGQVACFWSSNYLSKVVITNGAIGTFYTNRQNVLYRLMDRITLAYVDFSVSNYLADADTRMGKVTNLNEHISDIYFRGARGTNGWTDTNGVTLSEAAAKEKIREQMRQNEALFAARRAANDFGNELMSQADPNKTETLEKLAAAKGLVMKYTKPFDSRTNGLEEFDMDPVLTARASDDTPPESVRDVIRRKAFALPDDRPVQFVPVAGSHGVYVFAKKGKIPSELQPLEQIQDKVTADYKSFMAVTLARNAAYEFQTSLTNGLAMKKSFNELAAAAKIPVIDLPPFSPMTRGLTNLDSRINLRQIQGYGETLEPGQASSYIPAQPGTEGGYILYVKERPPVDPAKLKAELPEFMNQLRAYRQNEAFQQWFRKQADQAKLSVPKRETSVGTQGQP
jgi:hypothetical protein